MDTLNPMEAQKPKIPFYVRRSFGEKLNACFDFIKENFRPLLKYSTYFILPLALIQALSMNSLMNSAMTMGAMSEMGDYGDFMGDDFFLGFFLNYFFFFITFAVGSLLLTSVVYSLVQLYNSREERLLNITFDEIKPKLFHNMKRLFLVGLFMFGLTLGVMLVVVLLAVLTPFTLILSVPALFVCYIPLTLMAPIYLFEEIGLMDAFTKAFRLGFATWGGIFAVMFVTGLIASIIQGAASTPYSVLVMVQSIFTLSEGSFSEPSIPQKFFTYLLGVINVYGMYISMIISLIGLMYQYSHSSDIIDHVSVESDINTFDQF